MSRTAVKNIQGERFGAEKEIEAITFLGTSNYIDTKAAEWLFKCHRCGDTFNKHTRNIRGVQSCGSTQCRKYYSRKRRGVYQ